MLRKLVYLFLIVFFVIGSIAAYTVLTTVNRAQTGVMQPVGDLVRQLVIPATPVILPSATVIVQQINDIARLETATVEMEKVITADRNSDILWGALGETMVFVANGKVVAGIDFAEMEVEDLQVVDPDTVWVHLPPARIFDDLPVIDNEKSRVVDRDTGLFTRADPQLESEVRRVAEQTIREEALGSGVVERANDNARAFMTNFLNELGFENVEFYDDTPPTPPPFEQEVPKGQVLATPTPGQ